MKKFGQYFVIFFMLGMASGCTQDPDSSQSQDFQGQMLSKENAEQARLKDFLKKTQTKFPAYFSMKTFKEMIEGGDVQGASRYVNQSLQINPSVPSLHILNGIVYEEMARCGDIEHSELVGVAYRSAYLLDPSQWYAAYLLGMYNLRNKNYQAAQEALADALILKPQDPSILYGLAYASYYLKDLPVANSSISKLLALKPDEARVQKAGVIILSASGRFNAATRCLESFGKIIGKDHPEYKMTEKRLEDWRGRHTNFFTKTVAGNDDTAVEGLISKASEAASDVAAIKQKQASAKVDEKAQTVILECYFLRSGEKTRTIKGQNILEVLQVAFGLSGNPLAKVTRNIDKAVGEKNVKSGWKKTFNYGIYNLGTPLKYSLNIANAQDSVVEVCARPTISTVVGKPAYFLDGSQYTGAAGGSTGSSIASIDAGIRLEVTPLEILPDGRVTLEISASGSVFINLPSVGTAIAEQMIGTTRSKVASTVHAAFGETVLVGGIYSRESLTRKTGVPILQDIPFIQYFFANQLMASEIYSTIYLITPRRGGDVEKCFAQLAEKKRIMSPSPVLKHLEQKGLMALGEYPALYYILKGLANSPAFCDFRSGDLPDPFWGYDCSSLDKKIEQLSYFLFF